MSEHKMTCFVIMPFSQTTPEHTEEYWSKHYDSFLKPLIEDNLQVIAHRSEPLRGDIVKQIINDLVVSPIVVADLTDKNANVFWELGIRQSFKHGTITIAKNGTVLPFDIGGKSTLFYYPNDHIKMTEFISQFKEAIKDCLSHPERPDSEVLESITGRGTLYEILHRDEIIRKLDAVILECENNLEVMNIISNLARNNKNIVNKNKVYSVRPFNLSAIELLITERYVNEHSSFFLSAMEYFIEINILNGQIYRWIDRPELAEEYIRTLEEGTTRKIHNIKTKLLQIHDNISERF